MANLLSTEEIASILTLLVRRVQMNSDEAYQSELGSRPHGRASRCASTRPAGRERLCAQRYAQEHVVADCACAKETWSHARCATGCALIPEGVDWSERWIASYVRTRLRTMAGDTFLISRHTTDCVAKTLHAQFLLDTDAVLQRILDFAALRNLYEGSTNVTLDDVRVALCSAAPPSR